MLKSRMSKEGGKGDKVSLLKMGSGKGDRKRSEEKEKKEY